MKVQLTITLATALALVVFGAVGCSKNSTPTKTVQTLVDAMKNKDVKAFKSIMSKDQLNEGEKEAKANNTTFDEQIKKFLDQANMSMVPDKFETRNETIASDGKTATLEIKDIDFWRTMHFIKEDDGWKFKDHLLPE